MPSLGADNIQKSDSEVHLGVDRNHAGTVNISARVQMGRRTMYAMMGAGAHGQFHSEFSRNMPKGSERFPNQNN